MIDVKSHQIPLLAKGQTRADSIREPIVFPAFSLDAGPTNDRSDQLPPHDASDDSTETGPGGLALVGGAVALMGADIGPRRLSLGNSDPTLGVYSKGTPLNSAGDANVLTAAKMSVFLGVEGYSADRGVTLPTDSTQERTGIFVSETPTAIGPIPTVQGGNGGRLPVGPPAAVGAEKGGNSSDPLPHPDQPSKVNGADVADISSLARAPDSNGSSELRDDLKPPQTNSVQPAIQQGRSALGGGNVADQPPPLSPIPESRPATVLETAASRLTDAADLGDSQNVEKPLSEDRTGTSSTPQPTRLTPRLPGPMPGPSGNAVTRAISVTANEVTPVAFSPAKGAIPEPSANASDAQNPILMGQTGAAAVAAKSEDTSSERAPARKSAPIGREREMPATPLGPRPGALSTQPKPGLVGTGPAAAVQHSHLSSAAPSVDIPPDGPAGSPESAMRYAPDAQNISPRTLDQKLIEKTPYSNLFDSKGETALGAIEPRSIVHSLGGSTAPVNAQQPVVVPRAIYQIAQAASVLNDRPVELSLNPEELGRVRLTLHSRDGNLTVNVAAERPETLLFLRRHIDQLATQLRDIGYQELTFAFSDQGRQFNENRNDPHPPPENNNDFSSQWEGDKTPVRINLTKGAGVDIRL